MDAIRESDSGYLAHHAAVPIHDRNTKLIQRFESYYYRLEPVGSTTNIAG